MKKPKYTTTFSSVIKPVVSEEKDKYLALASMVELEKFLPQVDVEKNVDFFDVYQKFSAFEGVSINLFSLTLDWLYLLGVIDNSEKGFIRKCF